MRIFILALPVIMMGTYGYAGTACDDLWLARNAIFDLHGYCFGSTLGKSVFDNTECTTVEPELAPKVQERIEQLWQRAKQLECTTNQGQASISVYNIEQRIELLHQPIASEKESACIGYIGKRFNLYDASDINAARIGSVDQGDDIAWFHDGEGAWSFMTVLKKENGSTPVSGWSREKVFPNCKAAAG
jgi:hypothetical protein